MRILFLVTCLVFTFTLSAQEEASNPSPQPGEQLQQIAEELTNIRVLLERQVENQDLQLLIRRSELVSTEVGDLEKRLLSAKSQLASLEGNQERLEIRLEGLEDSPDIPAETLKMILNDATSELAKIAREHDQAENEIITLENRLSSKDQELREWKDILDRSLRDP